MTHETCAACSERPVDHPATGECHRCYQRRWRTTNPQHNRREGKRGEQKRAWDRKHKKTASLSEPTCKTPGNQSDPATVPAARGHGNQEGPS